MEGGVDQRTVGSELGYVDGGDGVFGQEALLGFFSDAVEEGRVGVDVVKHPKGRGRYVGERGLDVEDIEAGDV